MAILKEGINGPFSGRVGNIVGYQLNGQNIIRSLPRVPKNRKPTEAALANRRKIAAVSKFLRPLIRVLRFGYRGVAPKGSRIGPFQAAQSHTFRHALDYGDDGTPYVNPEKVLVFRGELEGPTQIEAERHEGGIRVTWDNTGQYKGKILALLAYVIDEEIVLFEEGAAQSVDGIFDWETGNDMFAQYPNIHLYAGYYHILTGKLSDSVYIGCV